MSTKADACSCGKDFPSGRRFFISIGDSERVRKCESCWRLWGGKDQLAQIDMVERLEGVAINLESLSAKHKNNAEEWDGSHDAPEEWGKHFAYSASARIVRELLATLSEPEPTETTSAEQEEQT